MNEAKQPDKTGKNRDTKGRFVPGTSGNPSGRPKGSFSITELIKKELEEIPKGQNTSYLELLVKQILTKAVQEGDHRLIKQIWEHIDGRPMESVEMSGKGSGPIEINIVKYANPMLEK